MYSTADGGEIANLGEQNIRFQTQEGHRCGMTFQVADVKRPLLSVPALAARGNRVTFDNTGGTIIGPKGDQKVRFHTRRGVYVLDLYVAPFQGQGK